MQKNKLYWNKYQIKNQIIATQLSYKHGQNCRIAIFQNTINIFL